MARRRSRPARAAAQFRSETFVYIDHAKLIEGDLTWLAQFKRLTLWAVEVPPRLLSRLPKLSWLDIRGGSAADLKILEGCRELRYLEVNQVRGVTDITAVASLEELQFLSIYGQPKLTRVPDLRRLKNLRRVELGSLKGLEDISGLLAAPGLEELLLSKMVRLTEADVDALAQSESLREFYWFAEDVPDRVWVPVRDRLGLRPAKIQFPEEWFRARGLPVP